MEVPDRHSYLCTVKLDNLLSESLLLLKHFIEFSSFYKRHDKVKAELRLEQIVHTHEERMIAREQDILLQFSVVDLVILKQDILSNGFNSIEDFVLLELSKIYLAESTSAKDDFQFEIFKLHIHLFS